MPAKPRQIADVIGKRIAHYRAAQKLTQREVEERTDELGHKIERTVLAKIERGGTRAQNISVVDLLVIAAALDVPPPLLFLPLGDDQRVAITPEVAVHPHLALDWVAGDAPFVRNNQRAVRAGIWRANAWPVGMFRELRELQDDVDRAPDDATRTAAFDELAQHLEAMERGGLNPPRFSPKWSAELESARRRVAAQDRKRARRSGGHDR